MRLEQGTQISAAANPEGLELTIRPPADEVGDGGRRLLDDGLKVLINDRDLTREPTLTHDGRKWVMEEDLTWWSWRLQRAPTEPVQVLAELIQIAISRLS